MGTFVVLQMRTNIWLANISYIYIWISTFWICVDIGNHLYRILKRSSHRNDWNAPFVCLLLFSHQKDLPKSKMNWNIIMPFQRIIKSKCNKIEWSDSRRQYRAHRMPKWKKKKKREHNRTQQSWKARNGFLAKWIVLFVFAW